MKICAGIVLYNPDTERLILNTEAIKNQVDRLIFIDNASKNIDEIQNRLNDERFIWILNDSNTGIATALNQLIDHAEKNDYEWILTLDQDSICETDLIKKMHDVLTGDLYDDIGNTAMISPRIIDRGIPEDESSSKKPIPDIEEIRFCITSGSLTNIKAIKETGGFNDWLFIYDVDREICIRLLRNGYKILRINNADLYHEHGEKTVYKKIFRKKIIYHNYSPLSVYYMTRNLIYMLRKYGSEYSPHPKLRRIRLFFAFCVKFIFERDRMPRLKAFTKGIREGFKADIKT